jgi:hypothetical protein
MLARLNELGDVVVGVEALACLGQALADLDGHGRALVGVAQCPSTTATLACRKPASYS